MSWKRNGNRNYAETSLNNLGEPGDEGLESLSSSGNRKISSMLISQLPSRHLDELFVEESGRGALDSEDGCSLRRKDSALCSLQLKNATLNSRQTNLGVEKIYEVLSSIPDADDKVKTLREMHQPLTIKRKIKEKLDADRRRKIATESLSLQTRFKLRFLMSWDKFTYELKNIAYLLEPWHSSIKTIQGKFGSGVASYFIFLRWLLYMNIWNFLVTLCFVVIPQVTYEASKPNSTNHNLESFEAHDLLTGAGSFSNSYFYFGHYTNERFQAIPNVYYNMPLAYLLTICVNFLINLIAISSSITASYQKNFIDTSGEIKHVFCNKVFSAWDYTIETDDAALLQKQTFCNDIKEILYIKRDGLTKMTTRQKIIQRTCLVAVSLVCYGAIGAIGYLIYDLLQKKSLQVDIKILSEMTLPLAVTFIASTSYFLLKGFSVLEAYLSSRVKLYMTMVRVVSLRIVMLGIIVYFWIVIYKPPRAEKVCYENKLGEEIYRLILINFLVTVSIFTLIFEFLRTLLRKIFTSIQKPEFDVAFNILDLIYYQTLAWIAIFSVPMGSLMIIVILILLFYLKKFSLSMNCQAPKRCWSLNEAHTFYLILTFVMFIFAAVAVAYSVFGSETSPCGPFSDHKNIGEIFIDVFKGKGYLTLVLKYLMSSPVLFAIFCFIGIIVYQMRAQAKAHISVIKKIREQLILCSKDKVFLLKLFDEAFEAELRNSSKSKVEDPDRAPTLPPPKKPKSPINSQDDNFFGNYSDPPDRPITSPRHAKASAPHTPLNSPGSPGSYNNSPISQGYVSQSPSRKGDFRTPVSKVGKDSPRSARKRSPYPTHEHGFRHIVGSRDTSQS